MLKNKIKIKKKEMFGKKNYYSVNSITWKEIQ
jgi:hypothetical protein